MPKTPKLPLEDNERRLIRNAGVRLAEISKMTAIELSDISGIPLRRCEQLVAFAQFQTLDSVGLHTAEDLWVLGYRRIRDLIDADPVEMYQRLMRITGKQMDPCVEDSLRCAVAQALNPALPKSLRQWWAWQEQRGKPLVVPNVSR